MNRNSPCEGQRYLVAEQFSIVEFRPFKDSSLSGRIYGFKWLGRRNALENKTRGVARWKQVTPTCSRQHFPSPSTSTVKTSGIILFTRPFENLTTGTRAGRKFRMQLGFPPSRPTTGDVCRSRRVSRSFPHQAGCRFNTDDVAKQCGQCFPMI